MLGEGCARWDAMKGRGYYFAKPRMPVLPTTG